MKNIIFQSQNCYRNVVLSLTILVSACSDPGMADLEKTVREIKAIKNPHVDPMPEYISFTPYFYEPSGRDPFIPFVDAKKPKTVDFEDTGKSPEEQDCPNSPNPNRIRVGLEDMPLDALKMVGLLKMDGIKWALVVSKNDGTIFRVKQNDYIGDNYGQIINISEDEMEILELHPDGKGCWKQEIIKMKSLNQLPKN
jgi:type IV pilus assembly protein PilP